MKKTCPTYNSRDISLYIDNELSCEKQEAVKMHIDGCAACREMVKQYNMLSTVFARHTIDQVDRMDTSKIRKSVPAGQGQTSLPIFGWFGKSMPLKLASLAAVAIVCIFGLKNTLFTPTGPSAIVKSVDTEYASVMIIETQEKKHTIIWFSET